MSESRDYLEMSFRSIQCFSNDGRLDADEFGKIVDIALRDGVLDANEMRVLHRIVRHLTPAELTPGLLARLEDLKRHYKLD